MPQKGLKKDDEVRGRREEISSKFFPFFPDHKSTFIGNSTKRIIPLSATPEGCFPVNIHFLPMHNRKEPFHRFSSRN